MSALILYRIDPGKRMQRYYRLDVQENLFGEWCLIRAALGRQRVLKERRGLSSVTCC